MVSMFLQNILAVAVLAVINIHASPVQERNLTPAKCSQVVTIVDVLKVQKATPFCSSFLSINPATATSTVRVTSTVFTTTTATITSGTASTSIVFKPGNPPPKIRREADLAEPLLEQRAIEQREPTPSIPSYLSAFPASAISSACSCLSIPPRTTTVFTSSKATTTQTVTTSKTVTPPVVTSTKYPCATPVPSLIPTLPFGKSNDVGVGDLSNSLYGQGTTGTTREGCCNLCYFNLPNCIQAIYYDYQGCVVRQPAAPTGTGVGVSAVCPNGKFAGLTYTPDLAPPFRSQGQIAGPCGQVYNNL